MLTKFILHINNTSYELRDDDLKNWDEVRCAYKRANYDGVVRSFTSQFEFVNRAYELLQEIFLRDRYNAVASIEVQTIDDRWIYHTQFACPLDFSTISWDSYVLSINSVDNSLAALIKANKGTKYEFTVGSDIPTDKSLFFERIPMNEKLSFRIIGESNDEDASMVITKPAWNIHRVYVGLESDQEVSVNGALSHWGDQTEDAGSYILEAKIDVKIKVEAGFAIDLLSNYTDLTSISFRLYKTSVDGTDTELCILCTNPNIYFGEVNSPADLTTEFTGVNYGVTALVKSTNTIWKMMEPSDGVVNDANDIKWRDTGLSLNDYMMQLEMREAMVDLKAGDKVWIGFTSTPWNWNYQGPLHIKILDQVINISWAGKGESENIDTISPRTLCDKLLERIAGTAVIVNSRFSNYDSRFANTYLLAAESIRALPVAKIYSSFTEFSEWMQAVFGYTYYIGELKESQYVGHEPFFTEWPLGNMEITDDVCPGQHTKVNNLVFIEEMGVFAVLHGVDFKFCTHWEKSTTCEDDSAYNDPKTKKARLDKVFVDEAGEGYYVDAEYKMRKYDGEIEKCTLSSQSVYFVHRSELLQDKAPIRRIASCRGVKYSTDASAIYSAVTVGYDKKDYEGLNGRDEFNFNNTYSTGCTVTDKTLSLISKYRADCYGIEFTVQKRGADTTDSTSDKDVFFLLCEQSGNYLVPDRTLKIENTVSDSVFNGAFSPMACVKANAGFIGLQADRMTLAFASSTGNSDIVIGGVPMSGNILIDKPIATCGVVEFTTDEVGMWDDANDLVEIENEGVIYRGYMREVEFKYAHTESAKYKLIIKDIEL